MTREEAIDILNDERIVIWTEPHEEEIARKQNEAIDMAIKALSAEQKEEELANDIARRMATIIENEQDMRVLLKNASTELLKDGTLKVNVKSGAEASRVLVWGDDGCGGLYYADDRPSGEWIPCSERMPEDGQAVIICTDDKRFKDNPVGTCIYEYGRFHTNFHDDINMIAWMPLPKPYCPNCGAKMGGNK